MTRSELIIKYLDNEGLREWYKKRFGIDDIKDKCLAIDNIDKVLPSAEEMIEDIRKCMPTYGLEFFLHSGHTLLWNRDNDKYKSFKEQDWQTALLMAWLYVCFGIDT